MDLPHSVNTRKEAVLLIEVVNSNPNGDPDEGGAPRRRGDRGMISDVSIKRHIRDFAAEFADADLYVEKGADLSDKLEAMESAGAGLDRHWDLRTFGGLLTKIGKNTGKKDNRPSAAFRGPVQISDAISIDPVYIEDVGFTRSATHASADNRGDGKDHANMGRRHQVTYGLYKATLSFSARDAAQAGMTDEDLKVFWQALAECWDHSRASNRTGVRLRRLYVFDHPHDRGVELSWVTHERVKVAKNCPGQPETLSDYTFNVDTSNMPHGLRAFRWADGRVEDIG